MDGKALEEDETNSFGVQITNKCSTCTFYVGFSKWIALTNSELRTPVVGGQVA